jgi:branched-chain amino acid transport system substrate-binding protein
MKKFFQVSIICLFTVSLMVMAVGGVASAAPKTIKIASVVSATGNMAGNALQAKMAYDIAVNKVNADGGIYVKQYDKKLPIELKVLDDESNGQKTQTQLEVANSWGAVANLGGIGCSSFEMGTPICQKNKMTWIGPGCGGWDPHQRGNLWMFSPFIKTKFFCPIVFDMIKSMPEPIPRKVAIFEINQLDAQEANQFWREKAKKEGFEIVFHQKYPMGTKDFSAMITGAKAAGAEILLAYPVPPMGPTIVKQMKELDYSPKLTYWIRAPESVTFGSALGPLSDYVTVPNAWSEFLKLPGNDYLTTEYKKMTGRLGDPIVGPAYAAAEILFAAIEKAGALDRTAIRDAVRDTDMETVCGRIHFHKEQGWAMDRMIIVCQWMNGTRVPVYANAEGRQYGDKVPLQTLKWQPKWSER